MKKQLLIALACLYGFASTASAKTIYGYQTWEYGKELPFRGPISFDSATPGNITKIMDCSDMGVSYAGYYHDYHWYAQFVVKGTQSSMDGFYEIDMTTGERTLIAKGGTKCIDLTYNYADNQVYGIQNGNQYLVIFDPTTGSAKQVGKFANGSDAVYMLAIAAALDGTLYGIATDDCLYKIDRTTAALQKVGDTGYDAAFDQTMAFDYETGTLYWVNNGDYGLHTVDVTTGKATHIGYVGENGVASMASLFIPYINVAKGAPDRVTALTATATASSATLSWTAPTVTAQGNPLAELTGIKIMRDGNLIADIPATVGQAGTYTDNGLAEGNYTYRVVPYNAAGDGGVDGRKLTVHIGNDRPGAPLNLTATGGDGSATLAWQAPTQGAENGFFDPASITGYQIKRGSKLLATVGADVLTYTDATNFGKYTYSVAAVNDRGTGTEAKLENVLVKPADWIVMTSGETALQTGKEYKFYDEGGPTGGYGNQRHDILTLSPSEAGTYVCITFNDLSIEEYGDYLRIYNGRGTDASNMIGQYTGTFIPTELNELESTAADGCLTFEFYSDIMMADAGWGADVTVRKRADKDMQLTAFKAPTLTVAGTETKFTVSVANKGMLNASGYTVSVLSDGKPVVSASGPELESLATADIELTYTYPAEGKAVLTAEIAYDGDQNTANNTSAETIGLNILPTGSFFVEDYADNTTNMGVLPMSFYNKESISEILYEKTPLAAGANNTLAAIVYPLNECTTTYNDVPVTIWIGETIQQNLADDIIPASQLTKVFDGTVNFVKGSDEVIFNLTTPYDYKGGNLVVMVLKKKSPTNNAGIFFRGDYGSETVHPQISRFTSTYSDDMTLDPETTFGYSANHMRADIKLVFKSGSDAVSDITIAPAAGVTLRGQTISCDSDARIYSISGALLRSLPAGETCQLPAGMYLVYTATGTAKIAVR